MHFEYWGIKNNKKKYIIPIPIKLGIFLGNGI